MICVNFQWSEFRGGEARVSFCGQGEANSGTAAAAPRQHGHGSVLATSVPPSTPGERQANGSFQVCSVLKWRVESAGISEFCCQSRAVGNNRVFVTQKHKQARSSLPALGKASHLGAPILPGGCTRKENTFLGLAGHFFSFFFPSIGGGLRHSSPADHPAPPHSQRLFSRRCVQDTQGPRAVWKLEKHKQLQI